MFVFWVLFCMHVLLSWLVNIARHWCWVTTGMHATQFLGEVQTRLSAWVRCKPVSLEEWRSSVQCKWSGRVAAISMHSCCNSAPVLGRCWQVLAEVYMYVRKTSPSSAFWIHWHSCLSHSLTHKHTHTHTHVLHTHTHMHACTHSHTMYYPDGK